MAEIKLYESSKIKRERSENFDAATLAFLCDEVEKNIEIINSKQTNQITNKRKQEVWQHITDAVNARGGVPRTVSQLKEKYRKCVSSAKMEANCRRREMSKTGGGAASKPLNNTMQKLIDLNADSPSFSGIPNSVDLGVNTPVDAITIEDLETFQFVFDDGTCIQTLNNFNSDLADVGCSSSTVPEKEQNSDGTISTLNVYQKAACKKLSCDDTASTLNVHQKAAGKKLNSDDTVSTLNVYQKTAGKIHVENLKENGKGKQLTSALSSKEGKIVHVENLKENGKGKQLTSALSSKEGKRGKDGVIRPERVTNRIQGTGTANLKQLQVDALNSEKRKNEVEIEKFQEEKQKMKIEIDKLKEERDLFKIQKDYYQLKLKKLKLEMNEQ